MYRVDSCLFLYLENHRFNKLGCDTKESCNYVALCIGLKSSSARILACFEGESESKTKFLFWHFVLHRCSEQNTLFLLPIEIPTSAKLPSHSLTRATQWPTGRQLLRYASTPTLTPDPLIVSATTTGQQLIPAATSVVRAYLLLCGI